MKLFVRLLLPVVLFSSFALGTTFNDGGFNHNDHGGKCGHGDYDRHCKHHEVPEGGSSAMYLLLATGLCAGAFVIRRRSQDNQ